MAITAKAALLLFGLGLVLCSRAALAQEGGTMEDPKKQLEMLETLRKQGLMTDDEYAAKKAEMERRLQPAGPADKVIEEKLKALAAAHEAGILSDEEYARKKAELEAQRRPGQPQIDEAARQKLKALEAALAAGILAQDEFDRKKAELLKQPAPSAGPAAGRKGKTFKHAVGFTFWYPDGWSVNEVQGGLQLVPSNPGTSPEGPTEFYLILGDNAAARGITKPDDPTLIAFLDQNLRGTFPFLTRSEKVDSVDMAKGKGAVLSWEGKNPQGKTVRAKAYVGIVKEYGMALVGLGLDDLVAKRDPDLRAMFVSFGLGEGERDPKLVGVWRCEKYYSSGDASTTTIIDMALAGDGSFVRGSRLLGAFKGKDSGGDLKSLASVDTGAPAGSAGRWSAGNGTLYLMYKDGTYAQYGYYIETKPNGAAMLLKTGDGKKELWERIQ